MNIEDIIFNYDKVKDLLSIRVVNTERNLELINQVPHEEVLDLAVIPYAILENRCCTISNDLKRIYGVSTEELIEQARRNGKIFCPMSFRPMEDYIHEVDSHFGLYVVSNGRALYGAGTLFYDGSLEMIYEKLGTDFFVIPSSVHEFLVFEPYGMDLFDVRHVENMIREVNDSIVEDDEILSYSLYFYDGRAKELRFANKKEGFDT